MSKMSLYVLKPGDMVRLKNGLVVMITSVDMDTDFKYCINGQKHFEPSGVTRNYSWTRDGKYYDDRSPDGRDIEEVLPRIDMSARRSGD